MYNAFHIFALLHNVAACLLLLTCCIAEQHHLASTEQSKQAVRDLFKSLDRDGDGQIRESEASAWISMQTDGGHEEAQQLMQSLDGIDTDDTISIEELERNLDLRREV
jgi:Ca2+-binding EF-hand superfamily protein